MKTVKEYKEAIVELVKQMEKEHGCDVISMEMETKCYMDDGSFMAKRYEIKMEM